MASRGHKITLDRAEIRSSAVFLTASRVFAAGVEVLVFFKVRVEEVVWKEGEG